MTDCGGAPGTFFHDPDYEGYGVKLMGGYCFEPVEGSGTSRLAYRSPGHNSAYYDPETGRYFLIFHTRFAKRGEMFRVRVHQICSCSIQSNIQYLYILHILSIFFRLFVPNLWPRNK